MFHSDAACSTSQASMAKTFDEWCVTVEAPFKQLTDAIENSNIQIAKLQANTRSSQASGDQRNRKTLTKKNGDLGTLTSTTNERWREWATKYRVYATAKDPRSIRRSSTRLRSGPNT